MSLNKESVMDKIDEISSELKQLAIDIHDNPELGFHEVRSSKLHSDLLKEHGFEVSMGITDYPTAFKAVHKSKKAGPVIAFLAEYDALPGIGHACGHNLVGTVATGAGIASCQLVDHLGGEIRVYGTPAEENGGTKAMLTDQGIFDDCDVVLMAHPAYCNTDNMNTLALKTAVVEFFGKTSHAAASPELGINALDAAVSTFNMINALRQQTRPDARIHGIIEDGGKVPNIIPDYTRCVFYIRANDSRYCNDLYEKVLKIIEAAALGSGCTYKVKKLHHDLDNTKQNLVLSEIAAKNMESFGEKVMRLNRSTMPVSSDIGNVSYRCPCIQMCFRIGEPDSGSIFEAHTIGFARDARTEEGLDAMIRAAKVLSMTTYDILSDPKNLTDIKNEFDSTE